jgi:3-hydroxyisobutyrate dehydrogenase-like beta-hydroxyacid dehydrogenase
VKIGLVGLGAMGLPVAERLAHGGHELALFDVDDARLAAADGLGRRAGSVAEATRGTEAVFTILPADRHVEVVVAEIEAAGTRGQVVVDLSTIGPATIERVAGRLDGAGLTTVSATITRGTAAARRGELVLFVGTDGGLPGSIRGALGALAAEIHEVGGYGAAKALKIANNVVLCCLDIAMCEAILVGRRVGVDAERLTEQLATGSADSWALRNHIVAHVLTDDLGPGRFSTRNMAKDVGLFLDLATAQGGPASLAGVAAASYRGAIAHGLGEAYHPAVIRWLELGADGSGAVTTAVDGAAAVLCRAVAAIQVVIDLEALRSLAAWGIAPAEAAPLLESGSAGNDGLERAVRHLDGDEQLEVERLASDLSELLELANTANVPATMFEVGRQAALASVDA